MVPTGHGYSPYAAPSTYAGKRHADFARSALEDGWLTTDDVGVLPSFPMDSVAFADVSAYKEDLLIRAWKRFSSHASPAERKAFDTYCETHADWLEDWALFETIKQDHDEKEWMTWRADLRDREPSALISYQAENADQIAMRKFWQFLFEQQWMDLKSYCNERGIRIFGDLPIYVAQDSADVWANRHLFTLKEDGYPTTIAGVPPDYFSETGQRWGNPLYKWDSMRATGYAWWTSRMARILELVDLVRLDHFRGFEAYWEVPASEETAIHGQWREGPGADLFDKLEKNLGDVPLIAENLGVITEGVTKLMDRFGFPGMAILQFAFDSDESNEFLPHNYREALVAYTGTHDNDTLMGWWSDTASTQNAEQIARAKAYCTEYLGLESGHEAEQLSWKAIESPHALGGTLCCDTRSGPVGTWRLRPHEYARNNKWKLGLASCAGCPGCGRRRPPGNAHRGIRSLRTFLCILGIHPPACWADPQHASLMCAVNPDPERGLPRLIRSA